MCEHEVDWSLPLNPPTKDAEDQRWMEPGDCEDIARWKAACIYVYCKKCGCRGISVDDTGEFWDEEKNGRYI